MSRLGSPLAVARVNAPFRRLLVARATSALGGWVALIALSIYVYDLSGSAKWLSALALAELAPALLVAFLLAPLVDRWPRRRLLLASDLTNCLIFVALPFVHSLWVILALAAVSGATGALFRPALYAGLPNLVDEEHLPDANALLQVAENFAFTVGPLLGGSLLVSAGPESAFFFNALTFAVSGFFVLRIPARLFQSEQALSSGHFKDIIAGYSLIRRSRTILAVFITWSLAVVPMAAENIARLTLAKSTLGAGSLGFTVMITFGGIGHLLGSFSAGRHIKRLGVQRTYVYSLVAFGATMLALGLAPTLAFATASSFLLGMVNGIGLVCHMQMIQAAPDVLRGRVFTTLIGTMSLMAMAGTISAGVAIDAIGTRPVFVVAAGLLFFSGALAALLLWGGDDVKLTPGVEEEAKPETAAAIGLPAASPGEGSA